MAKMRFSRWNILTIVCLVALCYTTFQPVIQATVVHSSVAGSIFDISAYVGELGAVYAPWLGMMLTPGAGERTAFALQMGAPALQALCVIAIGALVLVAACVALNIAGKRKVARVLGVTGFVLAVVVPAISIVLVAVVQAEMSSPVIAIDVLGVRPVCWWQLAIAALGLFAVITSTHIVLDTKEGK